MPDILADVDVTYRFEPASRDGGRFTYSGIAIRFPVQGDGTYQVKYADDVAVSITTQGKGTVETPYGPVHGSETEHYDLQSLGIDGCNQP